MSEPEAWPMSELENKSTEQAPRELPAELKALEARLVGLAPRDDRLNRERLMFLAGRASAEGPLATGHQRPRRWLKRKAWPVAFAGMTAIAAVLLVSLINRPIIYRPHGMQIAAEEWPPAMVRPAVERTLYSDGDVLSAGDARHRDIEKRVSSESRLVAFDASDSALNHQQPATLRPGAWRQIVDGLENLRPNSNDSSNMQMFHGAKS